MDRLTLKHLQRKAKDILSKKAADRRIAAVDGYLLALETLYEDSNTNVSFSFGRIDGTADRALEAASAAMGEGMRIELAVLTDWKRELTGDVLQGYLPHSLQPDVRERLAHGLMILLNRATGDTASAWRVLATPTDGKYFHCAWQTYLFATPDGFFLLHCAIDD